MRSDPYTGEMIDVGIDSSPCPIADGKHRELMQTKQKSRRRHLLRQSEAPECLATQSAEDVPLSPGKPVLQT